MRMELYVQTGTGNSLWTARLLAAEIGDTAVRPMPRREAVAPTAELIGIVFPVHMWGLPSRVIRFADLLQPPAGSYLFAVAVNAGQPAATLLQLAGVLNGRNLRLDSGFSVVLPSNYISWGGPPPEERQRVLFQAAREKTRDIAAAVAKRQPLPPERGPAWQNLFFTLLYRWAFPHVPSLDKKFLVDERCNSCGICAAICPAGNIELREGRPVWLHQCEQCFACLQWCPREAIQYGEKTRERRRYRHPEVSLADMRAISGRSNADRAGSEQS